MLLKVSITDARDQGTDLLLLAAFHAGQNIGEEKEEQSIADWRKHNLGKPTEWISSGCGGSPH